MIKSFISKIVMLATVSVCLNVTTVKAYDGHAPLQAFIDRERSEHEFMPVSNLWEDDKTFTMSQAAAYVKNASFFTLNYANLSQFMSGKERCINLVLPKEGGGTFEIALAQYVPLTGNFSVDADVDGRLVPHNYTPGLYYRGVVNGIPGSVAAFSFFDDEIYGVFSIPNVGNYVVVPNTLLSETNHNHYIMYNDADLLIAPQGPGCSTDQLPDISEEIEEATGSKNVFNSCKEIKIYVRADRATYASKGSNVTTVTNWITSIYNVISTLYRNEGIYVALHKVIVNTTTDAYASLQQGSFNFLNKFGELTQNTMEGADLAVLFSTRFNAQMGGVAWLDVLCDNYATWQGNHFGPYAFVNVNASNPNNFPTYSWNTGATAHELGHNLGSPHTHACGFWQGGLAIDGCTTLEDGPCGFTGGQQYPSNGGTIMSYCHLVQGVGVNFSQGFGTQPGNLIRNTVNTSNCPVIYAPNIPVTAANANSNANRECTDPSGVTYYWNDGINADTSGDRLVLKIKKGTNNIGNLDQTGFIVRTTTLTGIGGGAGVNFILPAGIMSGHNVAMHRFWRVIPTAQPTSEVEVFFPFTSSDVSDVDSSVPGIVTATDLKMYSLSAGTVDPNPSAGLTGATSANMKIYNNGSTPSSTVWKLSPVGSTQFAQFKTTTLNGGTLFMNYPFATSLEETQQHSNISIYPNPVKDSWTIAVPSSVKGTLTLQLYTTDGKVMQNEILESGKANVINSKALPAGIYFYRVISTAETLTGTIIKE